MVFLSSYRDNQLMNLRCVFGAVVLSAVFLSSAMASLIGSTYAGTVATSASDLSVTAAGDNSYTDLTNPFAFCVTGQGQSGCGLSGIVTFSNVGATESDITFQFSGSVTANSGDTFTVNLGDFVTLDGSVVSGVDPASPSSLGSGSFQLTSFDGADAIFTGTVGADGSLAAVNGQAIVFDDALINPTTPEPASALLAGCGLAALAVASFRKRASATASAACKVK